MSVDDHKVLAPESIRVAMVAVDAMEGLIGQKVTTKLRVPWDDYQSLPEAYSCGFPARPVKAGYCWRTHTKGDFHVGHVLATNENGEITRMEQFLVEFEELARD